MGERAECAVANHKKGYNCAQAVFCAFSDQFGIEEKTAFAVSEGFGRGMGGMRDGACGAVTAMCMVAGLFHSGRDPKNQTKQKTYQKTQRMCSAFKEKNGSIFCVDLLGIGTPGIKRPCDKCIEDAVGILEEMLDQEV